MLNKLSAILTRNETKTLVSLSIGSVLLALSETVSIGLIIPIMNLFVSADSIGPSSALGRLQAMTGLHDRTAFLTALILAAMAVFFAKSVYSVIMARFQFGFIGDLYCRITRRALSVYLHKPYSFHLDSNSSVLFKNIMTEVGQFTSGFLSPLIMIASETMVFIAILALLIIVYPAMTISLVIMLSALMLMLDLLIKRRIKQYSRDREIYNESMYVAAGEALSGIKEIQVNGVQDYFIERFYEAAKKYQSSFRRFSILSNLPRSILETTVFFVVLVMLLINLYAKKPPSDIIPMMIVLGAASIKLLPSINKIYLNFNSLHYYANSLDIVYSIVADRAADHSGAIASECGDISKRMIGVSAFRADKVSFSYNKDGTVVLDGVSMDMPFGRTTAVVGASGAGKSTLIDILTGLLVPSGGVLYFGDTAVHPENVRAIRKNIGYVPQQIFLIDDTIGANITFGLAKEAVDGDLLDKVIRMANLEPFISTLPAGLDTPAGDRGVKLSGGQRQRIGIARALYRSPKILILDEATSALDGNSEAEVAAAIKKVKDSGVAVVIVAHRLSTISIADNIYVMSQGKIAAEGPFKALRDSSEVFNKIVSHADR